MRSINSPIRMLSGWRELRIRALGASVCVRGESAINAPAIIRAVPNMTVLPPFDPLTTRKAVLGNGACNEPVYMRLGHNVNPVVHDEHVDSPINHPDRCEPAWHAKLARTSARPHRTEPDLRA